MSDLKRQKYGLPNVGNTCFINSIVNCLYSSSRIRQIMFKKEHNLQSIEKQSIKLLVKIFFSIKNHEHYYNDEKADLMYKFAKSLQQQLYPQYKFGQENDSLIYLMKLIEIMNTSNLFINQGQFFQFSYQQICKNQNKNHHKNQIYLKCYENQLLFNSLSQACRQCTKRLKKPLKNQNEQYQSCYNYLISTPLHLLMFNECNLSIQNGSHSLNVQKSDLYILSYQDQFSQKHSLDDQLTYKVLHYKIKAKSIYSGNGQTGHYTALRKRIDLDLSTNQLKQSTNYYLFDDHRIKSIQTFYKFDYRTKFILYELQTKMYSIQQIKQTKKTYIFLLQKSQQNIQDMKLKYELEDIKIALRTYQVLKQWNSLRTKETKYQDVQIQNLVVNKNQQKQQLKQDYKKPYFFQQKPQFQEQKPQSFQQKAQSLDQQQLQQNVSDQIQNQDQLQQYQKTQLKQSKIIFNDDKPSYNRNQCQIIEQQ